MAEDASLTTKVPRPARHIAIGAVLAIAAVFAFGTDHTNSELQRLLGSEFCRAVRILSRLWFFSSPAGMLFGFILGRVISRSSWLTEASQRFLRIARWAPFLIVWTLTAALTLAPNQSLSWWWVSIYGAVTVALSVAYNYLADRRLGATGLKVTLKELIRTASIHGLLIALLLDMSVAPELWNPLLSKGVGYSVSLLMVAIVLLINWASRSTFDVIAASRGRILIDELKTDSWVSICGAAFLALLWLLSWQVLVPFAFNESPLQVLQNFRTLLNEQFYRDVYTSFRELGAGMLISGGFAVAVVLVRGRLSILHRLSDILLQACQVAPIAALPSLQSLFGVIFEKWSILCVTVFSFYPFARAFLGLKNQRIIIRLLLATDEALPYGCAAFVFGEMWNANAGIGFMMTVAAATYQTSKGLAGFLLLLVSVAALSTILRWVVRQVGLSSPENSAQTERVVSWTSGQKHGRLISLDSTPTIKSVIEAGKLLAPIIVASKMIFLDNSLLLILPLAALFFVCFLVIERNVVWTLDFLERGIYPQDVVGVRLIIMSVACAFLSCLLLLIVSSEHDALYSVSILILAVIFSFFARMSFR